MKKGASVEGGGVPSFIGVRSSLDRVKNEGSCRGSGVPSFIGVHSKYGSREKRGSFRAPLYIALYPMRLKKLIYIFLLKMFLI